MSSISSHATSQAEEEEKKRRQDAQDAWTGGKDDTSVDLEGMIYIL
jgi:hypothetical protein